ncbi:hypothetical protein [Gottschalkia acidurici]|uniref:hypothetical protein n=1 Tax=Clostridium acidurici TaxID=1556 RepID=UPI0002E0DD83|nr:hypothetical protein [Gottschalkia acidurici]
MREHRKLKSIGTESCIWEEEEEYRSTLTVIDTPYDKTGYLICWEIICHLHVI